MPIEQGIWKVNNCKIKKINFNIIETEKKLEDIIYSDISILNDSFLIIGRQVRNHYNKVIDLLAINQDGDVIGIELKKDKTNSDIIRQSLDYASWLKELTYEDIKAYAEKNINKTFGEQLSNKYGDFAPETFNNKHEILIVATELDNDTERVINYLSDHYLVPINVVFFRFFKDENAEYISRSWLISPTEAIQKSDKRQSKTEIWNGNDYVVNIDRHDDNEPYWEDYLKYGFVSASGGPWYTKTLNALEPGNRIFAMLPKAGYLGVGIVTEKSVPYKDFYIKSSDGVAIHISESDIRKSICNSDPENLEQCGYYVKVDWTKHITTPYWEKGLRANQNSAFVLRHKFTLDKLIDHFEIVE